MNYYKIIILFTLSFKLFIECFAQKTEYHYINIDSMSIENVIEFNLQTEGYVTHYNLDTVLSVTSVAGIDHYENIINSIKVFISKRYEGKLINDKMQGFWKFYSNVFIYESLKDYRYSLYMDQNDTIGPYYLYNYNSLDTIAFLERIDNRNWVFLKGENIVINVGDTISHNVFNKHFTYYDKGDGFIQYLYSFLRRKR